ncbi:MAG: type II toxin-antitoxin system RelE/ParE family toxin [Proteobacteria bacterium]|nr:type II toxin-antitoxin system RelE/ParE family toxin [Pseudomonadota bacterium]
MALQLRVSRRAAREIERIVEWWAINRPAAPGAVRKELQNVLDLLLVQPDIGALVKEASSPEVRRFHVERIRYWLYYRVRENWLEVVSVWHASRGSGPTL